MANSSVQTKPTVKQAVKMGVFTLVIMNIVAVVSLRGLPAEAEYGVSSAFYYILAAVVFLVPVSLVAAELAAMFPYQQGGMFRWIGEAFGDKAGFLGIWLQWIESTIWYPTVLTFGAVSLAFIGMDHIYDTHLAANKFYTIIVVLAIYWLATIISLKGMGWVGKVSKIGGLVGTIIPVGLIVVCAVIYLATGGQSQMDWHGSFIPDFSNFNNIVLAVSIFLFYAGMEMSGVHVREIKNPTVNYPKAVIIGAIATVAIFILGTYALGVIIPAKDINLVQSLLVGFDNYFSVLHVKWLSPVIAIALAFGVLAGVLTWVAGPSKGILAVGQAGYLPKFFQKTNKNGVQKNILYLQGIVVTVLALLMVVMPSVESFYQILSQLTCILYLIAYLLMFASAIRLRYNMKDAPRPYRLGKSGNGVMWLIAGVGFIGSLLAFIFSFFPPSQIEMGSNAVWFSVLIFGTILFVVLPFIILAFKKKSWNSMGTDFVPFHWDNTPGAAQLRQKAAEEFAAENAEDTPEHAQALLSHASSINRTATSDSKADVKQ
ncbi:MAG: amino acid permease [Duncaniella sp.]|nr:amino acid permease [Duncaniella sp.]MDE6572689.1 amino acid permease [Duncaniella sp.]